MLCSGAWAGPATCTALFRRPRGAYSTSSCASWSSTVGKTIYPELPLRVEYFLTEQGQILLAVIDAMAAWGETHGDDFRERLRHRTAARPAQ